MTDTFTPRAGSLAQRLIDHLTTQPPGTAMSSSEIKEAFDVSANVATNLRTAVLGGALECERVGSSFSYSLPPPSEAAAAPDGKLQIATWSDGDVSVTGAQVNADSSVQFTRAQIEQLLRHCTIPHVALKPGGALYQLPAQE